MIVEMQNFIPSPTHLRTIERPTGNIVIEQYGETALVNGIPRSIFLLSTIKANTQHFLGHLVPAFERAGAVAIVLAQIDGKEAQITLDAEAWERGAAERERYASWVQGCVAAERDRGAAERAFDLGNNEGGEGYNPYRGGAERTYARGPKDNTPYSDELG